MRALKRSIMLIFAIILLENICFASDFTSIYTDLKNDYPQIITNLKSEGATDSDIQIFLNELSAEIGSTSNLTEDNFDTNMKTAFKVVLFENGQVGVAKAKYFNLAMAILNNYASTYTSGTLSGDMLTLRNVVMDAILGTTSAPLGAIGGFPVVTGSLPNSIETKVLKDSLGDYVQFDLTALTDYASSITDNKLNLAISELDLSTKTRVNLKNISQTLNNYNFVSIEMPDVSMQIEKDDKTSVTNKVINLSYSNSQLIFDWEETVPVIKDLNKPIQFKLDYSAVGDSDNVAVMRLLADGTYVSEGGFYDGTTISFFADKPGTYVIKENPKTFDDFSISDYWAANKVNRLATMGVIGGTSLTTYAPSAAITRAEFATLIVKMLKYDNVSSTSPFSDVSGSKWYAPYVQISQNYGLMSGKGNNTFDPDGNITQEEILIVLSKILAGREIENGAEESASSIAYKTSNISSWASGYVENAISNGALNGMPISFVDMKKDATRLETANMLYEIQNELYK